MTTPQPLPCNGVLPHLRQQTPGGTLPERRGEINHGAPWNAQWLADEIERGDMHAKEGC